MITNTEVEHVKAGPSSRSSAKAWISRSAATAATVTAVMTLSAAAAFADDFDTGPQKPPGKIGEAFSTVISWIKWGGLGVGAVVTAILAIMMIAGFGNRSQLAKSAITHGIWVAGGLTMLTGGWAIISTLTGSGN